MMEQSRGKVSLRSIIFLQGIIIIYTFSSVFGKMATTGNEFWSAMFFIYILLDFVLLAVYALLWQQALKRFDLSVAYANRAVVTIWSLVWSALIFKEGITVFNVVGTAMIIAGMVLVNSDAEHN